MTAKFSSSWMRLVHGGAILLLLGVCPDRVSAAPQDEVSVLLVGNGYYADETALEDHLGDFETFFVTKKKDYQINASTDLSLYDLIILTGFAPNVSSAGIARILESNKPILVIDYWSCAYSRAVGLVTNSSCGYVGQDLAEAATSESSMVSRLVGFEVPVYDTSYTVYGSQRSHVATGVMPLYYSSEAFDEIAVLYDPARRYASTGFYRLTHYTEEGWRMLDALVLSLLPQREGSDLARAFAESGLDPYLAQVEANPTLFAAEEVSAETWRAMVAWRFEDLAMPYLAGRLAAMYPQIAFVPFEIWIGDHPLRSGYPDDRWLMGDADTGKPVAWGDYITGTDLGIPVELKSGPLSTTWVYFGDTWGRNQAMGCAPGAQCNDAIGRVSLFDNDPTDGIDVKPEIDWVQSISSGYAAIRVPELHVSPWSADLWTGYCDKSASCYGPNGLNPICDCNTIAVGCHDCDGDGVNECPSENLNLGTCKPDPKYTVPTGAVSTMRTIGFDSPLFPSLEVKLPTIMLWYTVAVGPEEIDTTDVKFTPRSYAMCSENGRSFENCYGEGVAFSEDTASHKSRFTTVSAVEVSSEQLSQMCASANGYARNSVLCQTIVYQDGRNSGGLLLYGNGTFYRLSGLYLAWIAHEDIGQLNSDGRPMVYYLSRTQNGGWTWADEEAEASALSTTLASDRNDRYLETHLNRCSTTEYKSVCKNFQNELNEFRPWLYGEISATLIDGKKGYTGEPVVVLLSYHETMTFVLLRTASLSEPMELSPPQSTELDGSGANGYGPYIFDKYTTYTSQGSGSLTLWHTLSIWKGGDTPYGVYSTSTTISPFPMQD